MFYISLPYFYENFKFNQYFKQYVNHCNQSNNDKLIAKFNIEHAYGSFSWSYWNGGINNHQGQAILNADIKSIFTQTLTPIRIDASNINLVEYNYLDTHENIILNCANGTNTIYEISDTNLMGYISEHNLNNKFVISNNAQLIYPFNDEIINVFQEQETIDLINIGYKIENINLSQIKDKNKLEISIGICQNCSAQRYLECSNDEQKNIYNFSQQSLFLSCPLENKPINYYKEIESYLKQGIKHFKLTTSPKNLQNFNINIIKSFVKPEYQGECIDGYYREISK